MNSRLASIAILMVLLACLGNRATSASEPSPAPLSISTWAGSTPGDLDGYRTNATLRPMGFMGYDPAGLFWLTELDLIGFEVAGPGPQRIRRMGSDGVITTYSGGEPGLVEGDVKNARYRGPNALAWDSHGNTFVSERANHRIRKINRDGIVSTFAGSIPGYADGVGTNAQFHAPIGMVIDRADNLYVADFLNGQVRRITPDGTVATVASGAFMGPNVMAWGVDGSLIVNDWSASTLRSISLSGNVQVKDVARSPFGVDGMCIDQTGNLYIVANGPHTFSKLSPTGALIWSFGWNIGFADGPVGQAKLSAAVGAPVLLPSGDLLVADSLNNRIREIQIGFPAIGFFPGETTFTNAVEVGLSSASSLFQLRYTLDGSDPNMNSTLYTDPFVLTNKTTITARAFQNGLPLTPAAQKTYTRIYGVYGGISKAWQDQYFGVGSETDPRVDATSDPDGDGASNLQEFFAGTNPLDTNSFSITQIKLVPVISLKADPGKSYRLMRAASLKNFNPIPLTDYLMMSNAPLSYIDFDTPSPHSLYFWEKKPE